MAFTIPDLTDNKLNSVQTRAGDAAAMQNDGDDVSFHRHCQKTVLSAYGPDGQGATWSIIDNETFDNLPTWWYDHFTQNTDNITQDLKTILELINWSAGQKGSFTLSFKDISGNALANQTINLSAENTTYTFKFGRRVDLTFADSANMKFSFHPMKANFGGTDIVDIPLKNLKFKFESNTSAFNQIQTLMETDQTVEFPESSLKMNSGGTPGVYFSYTNFNSETVSGTTQYSASFVAAESKNYGVDLFLDRNRLFSTNAKDGANTWTTNGNSVPPCELGKSSKLVPSGSNLPANTIALWITPQWDWHVERVEVTDLGGGGGFTSGTGILNTNSTNIYLNLDIRNWGKWKGTMSFDQTICEIEIHIRNHKSVPVTITNLNNTWLSMPSEWSTDTSFYSGWSTRSLTDKNTIDPGYTNVYVFRLDFFKKRIINSLAYTFN